MGKKKYKKTDLMSYLKESVFFFTFIFIVSFALLFPVPINGEDRSKEGEKELQKENITDPNNNKSNRSVLFSELIVYDYLDGYQNGLISQSKAAFQYGRMINIDFSFHLDMTTGTYRTLIFRYTIKPIDYFYIEAGYTLRDYQKYRIAEHNLTGLCHIIIPIKNLITLKGTFGIDTRFVDIDTSEPGGGLNENWLRSNIIIWEASVFFTPVSFYETGIILGNSFYNEVVSIGYFQIENKNRFKITPSITLLADIGFAFTGTGSIAGTPNRFWFSGGIEYEISF